MPRIHDILPPDGPRRNERTDARRSDRADRPRAGSEAAPSDRLEISDDALRARDMQDRLRAEVRNTPEVREDRVAQVRERLASGEYDTDSTRRIIADRLLEQFGLT